MKTLSIGNKVIQVRNLRLSEKLNLTVNNIIFPHAWYDTKYLYDTLK